MKYSTVIIGAGIMGSATAYYLSKIRKDILLLDQYEIENEFNSSQDYSRVFRYEYGSDKFYSKLAVKALDLWKEVEKESKSNLYFQCGCLLLDNVPGSYAAKSYKVMKELGLDIKLLQEKELRKRFPQFSCASGVLDPNGGVLEANKAVATFISLARKNGVHIRAKAKVISIQDKSVVLEHGKKIIADTIVVASGAWATKLVKKIDLRATRQELIYFQPKKLAAFRKDVFPSFGHMESGFYGIPIHRINGVKIANHFPGEIVDPDKVNRKPSQQFVEECRAFFKEHIPDLVDAKVISAKVCLYDMTPDEDFILDKLSDSIVIGAGFSGHGFKFAPLIGKILADLAAKGRTPYDIRRFRYR